MHPASALDALCRPQLGRNRRISSNEQPNWNDGNMDQTTLPPGETFEMPLLEGPGVINHIWFTSHAGGMGELNALTLRIYWDGSQTPGVEAPMGDFFAVGQSPAVVESMPVQVSPTGALTCYWRMPFLKSARITVTNDNPDRQYGLYWQVDWVQLPELPEDTMRFYARYRQEYPATMKRDYLIADLAGRGHFVGTVMSVTMGQDGWFGEGDDFFYIDGEAVPSLQGTGTEDYFNDGWGFRPRTSHWFGQPRWTGYDAGDGGVFYRWHVLDPVRFEKSLRLTIEHKGNAVESEDGFFFERPDFISSVAFWYQEGEPAPFGELPSYRQRCVPWQVQHLVPQFLAAQASDGTNLSVSTAGMFGGRPCLVWDASAKGDTLELPFDVEEPGPCAVRANLFAPEKPKAFEVQIDGRAVLRTKGFPSLEFGEPDVALGTHDLAAGRHTLTLRNLADGPASAGLESLKWLYLPAPGGRDVKNENEAHFVRLGIGRAVYAHRLVYGKLPESLQALCDRGLMPVRYLRDENGHALECRLEGGRLIAKSTSPGGWESAWAGLDARR